MKYVNDVGPITSINECPQEGASREVPDDYPEVLAVIKKIDDALNGATPIDVKIDQQISSPLAQALLRLGIINEEKTRACLQEYFKTDIDIQL